MLHSLLCGLAFVLLAPLALSIMMIGVVVAHLAVAAAVIGTGVALLELMERRRARAAIVAPLTAATGARAERRPRPR